MSALPEPGARPGPAHVPPPPGPPRDRFAASAVLGLAVVGMHLVLIGSVSPTLTAPAPPAPSPPAAVSFSALSLLPPAAVATATAAPAPAAATGESAQAQAQTPDRSQVSGRSAPVGAGERAGSASRARQPAHPDPQLAGGRAEPVLQDPAPAEAAAADEGLVAPAGTTTAQASTSLAGIAPAEPAGTLVAGLAPSMAAAATGASPGGATAATPPSLPATPVYAVRPPAATVLRYRLSRGLLRGEGSLQWRPAGARYEAVLEGRVLGVEVLNQRSTGGFDAAGLAPLRFTDRRRGRDTQAANFQRDKGLVSFSGPSTLLALPAGAQDRVSWLVQLAAIANARPGGLKVGERLQLPVIGARGDADVWTFTVLGSEPVALQGDGLPTRADAVRLRREPDRPHDTRAEAWLDPARQHLPVRVRIGAGSDEPLELLLIGQSAP